MANDDKPSWWRNSAIGVSPAADRELLDVAIRSIDQGCNLSDVTGWADLKRLVCEAARKHLETLPKPMWRVTGWLPASADRAAPFETTSHEAALDFARDYLKQGMAHVSVCQVQS